MSWARLSAHADRAALDFMGGVSVIAGAVSGRGFLEENKELVFDDGVEVVPWLLKIKTAESMVRLARVDAPEETVVILDGDPGDDPITEPSEPQVLILDGSGS